LIKESWNKKVRFGIYLLFKTDVIFEDKGE